MMVVRQKAEASNAFLCWLICVSWVEQCFVRDISILCKKLPPASGGHAGGSVAKKNVESGLPS